MKINEIIREKRKEQSLTQEQMAEYLGVSTPAVNKWEKGFTYPDITLLPSIARLLKVDLNTLLSFNEDLTDLEVTNFINSVSEIIKKEGFNKGFRVTMEMIQKYPNSESLILSSAMTLQGALSIFGAEDKEKYESEIEKLYIRISNSDNIDIRNQVNLMLISRYMDNNEYDKAEALINTLPTVSIDRKQIQSKIYIKQEKYKEALKILEGNLIINAMKIQETLLCIMHIAQKESRYDDAEYYANISEKTVSLYELWDYNSYIAKFQLAVGSKDVDKCIEVLKDMIPSMKKTWRINESKLYMDLDEKKSDESFGDMMVKGFISEIKNDKELSFLVNNDEFLKLVDRYSN